MLDLIPVLLSNPCLPRIRLVWIYLIQILTNFPLSTLRVFISTLTRVPELWPRLEENFHRSIRYSDLGSLPKLARVLSILAVEDTKFGRKSSKDLRPWLSVCHSLDQTWPWFMKKPCPTSIRSKPPFSFHRALKREFIWVYPIFFPNNLIINESPHG